MPRAEVTAKHSDVDLEARNLAHSAWDRAQPVHITRYWSGGDAPQTSHAEVRLIWSDEAIHVRFVCNQHQPLIVSQNPDLQRKTLGVWDRDVCEIFLAPFRDQPDRYFEFEAAPNGEWVDLAVSFREGRRINDFDFVSGMTVAASLSDFQLVIGMRIPWSSIIPRPTNGDEWRANLFRCVGLGTERYLAWQPTYTSEPNFHVPQAFGRLLFT